MALQHRPVLLLQSWVVKLIALMLLLALFLLHGSNGQPTSGWSSGGSRFSRYSSGGAQQDSMSLSSLLQRAERQNNLLRDNIGSGIRDANSIFSSRYRITGGSGSFMNDLGSSSSSFRSLSSGLSRTGSGLRDSYRNGGSSLSRRYDSVRGLGDLGSGYNRYDVINSGAQRSRLSQRGRDLRDRRVQDQRSLYNDRTSFGGGEGGYDIYQPSTNIDFQNSRGQRSNTNFNSQFQNSPQNFGGQLNRLQSNSQNSFSQQNLQQQQLPIQQSIQQPIQQSIQQPIQQQQPQILQQQKIQPSTVYSSLAQPASVVTNTQTLTGQQQFVQQPQNVMVNTAQVPATVYTNSNVQLRPATNVVSTYVQPATNVVPVVQQAATNVVPMVQQAAPVNTVVQPTSYVLQQAPRVVPLVGVAAQPVQTIIQTLPQARPSGFGGLSGMGSGLTRNNGATSGMYQGMGTPLILKIEDVFPPSYNSPLQQQNNGGVGLGMGGEGGYRGGYNGDPNLSVINLDEGLRVVVNHSDPHRKIVNFPTPTSEEEAKALKKILEKAEAPEYIKDMVNMPFRGSEMGTAQAMTGPVMGNPGAATYSVASQVPAPAIVQAPLQQAAPTPVADMPIDEIIVNAYTANGGPTASYPLASDNIHGRFVLTALDMELTQQQFAELHASPTVSIMGRKKRKALTNTKSRWTDGVIPYEISGASFSAADQQQLANAMNQWSQNTCIQFRPALPSDTNRLVFRDGKGCSSNVGMIGGNQYLTLQKECRVPKILMHEIGHAIGLIHEHQREDRDNFLKINYGNIKPGGVKDFNLFKKGSVDHSISGYDYMSIMHYGKTAFARQKNMITMEAVDPKYTNLMGTAKTLSYSDVSTVNVMYGCVGGGGVAAGIYQAVPQAQGVATAVVVPPAQLLDAQPQTVQTIQTVMASPTQVVQTVVG